MKVNIKKNKIKGTKGQLLVNLGEQMHLNY